MIQPSIFVTIRTILLINLFGSPCLDKVLLLSCPKLASLL